MKKRNPIHKGRRKKSRDDEMRGAVRYGESLSGFRAPQRKWSESRGTSSN